MGVYFYLRSVFYGVILQGLGVEEVARKKKGWFT